MTDLPPQLSPKALAQQAELVALYRAAQVRLQKQLTGAALTDFQRFRIGEQLRQVDAVVAALDASVAEMAAPMAAAFYRHGTDLAGHALKAQRVAVGALDLGNQIHTAGLQAVADQMALDLHTANQAIARTSKDILRKTQQSVLTERAVNKIVAEGLVEGQTERQTTARLTDALKAKLGDAKLVTAGTRSFTPENYAEIVVRTRTREAVTAGAINRGLEYGVTLYQISVHSTSCEQCLPYQGKVYSIVPDERFPLLVERPPYHPRCRHVCLPYVEVPTAKGRAEAEALSELSQQAGPISDSQAGFQDAMRVASKIGGNRITAKQAATLKATTRTPAGRRKAVPPEKRTPRDARAEYDALAKDAAMLDLDGYQAEIVPLRQSIEGPAHFAVMDYAGAMHRQINDVLRNDNLATYRRRLGADAAKDIQEKIDTLRAAATFEAARPMKVYRGIGRLVGEEIFGAAGSHAAGVVIRDAGFMSVTTNPVTAEAFALDYGYVVEATLPKGAKFLPGSIAEQELILPPGAALEIVDIRVEKSPSYPNGITFVEALIR